MDKRFTRIKEIQMKLFVPTKNVLHKKDSSFGYLKYRILRPLIKMRYWLFRKSVESSPWLSDASIRFFKEYLNKNMVGCEFGSGGSTVFFAARVKSFVSVEHNKEWYSLVQDRLADNGLSDIVDYRLIEKQTPTAEESSIDYFPNIDTIETYSFRKDYINYFSALKDFPDEYFDFIIVDGRARPECVFFSINKLKSNGLMILDNSERDRYSIVFDNFKTWEMINTTNGLTNTTFWIKP